MPLKSLLVYRTILISYIRFTKDLSLEIVHRIFIRKWITNGIDHRHRDEAAKPQKEKCHRINWFIWIALNDSKGKNDCANFLWITALIAHNTPDTLESDSRLIHFSLNPSLLWHIFINPDMALSKISEEICFEYVFSKGFFLIVNFINLNKAKLSFWLFFQRTGRN